MRSPGRFEKLLGSIARADRGLEIGPGYSPLVPRSQGWNVLTVDHASQQGLVDKHRDLGVDTARIEPVDVVWTGGPLEDAIGREHEGTFRYCAVSHVLEHMPDPLGFLRSVACLLVPGGLLALALPDRRFCFDFFQPLTTTVDLLEAARLPSRTHSPRSLFRYRAGIVRSADRFAWSAGHPVADLEHAFPSLRTAHELYEADCAGRYPEYSDCHAWSFTPSSFALLILELSQLGRIELELTASPEPEGCEFYAILTRRAPASLDEGRLNRTRLELQRKILEELSWQHGMVRRSSSAWGRLWIRVAARLRRLLP